MAKRRTYGTGSVYKRASDGKWVGTLEAGWTAKGTRRRISVVAKTEAECKRRLRDKRIKLETEGADAAAGSRVTIKSWADEWLPIHATRVRPSTYRGDATAIKKWAVPVLGHRRLSELTPRDVRRMADQMRAAGLSSTTIGTYQGALVRMLKSARIDGGHTVPEAALMVPAPGKADHDRDAIPLEDALAILRAGLAKPDAPRWAAALIQGVRRGEALGLTWDHVDLDAGLMDVSWQLQALPYRRTYDRASGFRVPDGHESRHLVDAWHLVRPKSKKSQRVIPLLPEMVAALKTWREQCPSTPWGLVFPDDDGRPRDHDDDRAAWYALQDEVQVARVEGTQGRRYLLHEARHTTASLLLAAGVDVEVIKAIMGHSTILSTAAYLHVDQRQAREALTKVGKVLLAPA